MQAGSISLLSVFLALQLVLCLVFTVAWVLWCNRLELYGKDEREIIRNYPFSLLYLILQKYIYCTEYFRYAYELEKIRSLREITHNCSFQLLYSIL